MAAGVAKAFFTAHHAVLPETETKDYVARLEVLLNERTAPGGLEPIMFHKQFFSDGQAVKTAYPHATCLI